MATQLSEITKFLDEFLLINDIKDGSWNGLQFEGNWEVSKIAVAVDACIDSFQKAVDSGAQLLITHHGHFWKSANPSITKSNRERIKILGKNNLSLYAAHLPLDRHPEVGNNAQLLKVIGAERKSEFSIREGKNIGWIGEFSTPMNFDEIVSKLNNQLPTQCKTIPFGLKEIRTVAVCSGGGGYEVMFEAMNANVDLYLTGDAIDAYQTAKDAKFNVIFAGHNATETVGVKALAEVLKQKFSIDTEFIDLPTNL